MALQGKGFFIWKARDCEGGSAAGITSAARNAGLSHVILKIADGNGTANITADTHVDLLPPIVTALRGAGIQVWGWQFVYGFDPLGEAHAATQRIQQLNLDGFVIDAEGDYKLPGRAAAARTYMKELRRAFPQLPLALSSYRFPSLHAALPWKEFLAKCDYNMPQVYWEQSHNAADQLTRSVNEFKAMPNPRPVIPTAPAYKTGGWRPTENDVTQFMSTAQTLGLPAFNFFSWDECKRDLPEIWSLMAQFGSAAPPPTSPDVPARLFDALNRRDVSAIVDLFYPDAVFICPDGTKQGADAIRDWYNHLLLDLLPNATFTLRSSDGSGDMLWVDWSADCATASVQDGRDALGVLEGKIATNYTKFNLVKK